MLVPLPEPVGVDEFVQVTLASPRTIPYEPPTYTIPSTGYRPAKAGGLVVFRLYEENNVTPGAYYVAEVQVRRIGEPKFSKDYEPGGFSEIYVDIVE
jgi:hypothetical protein